jgi:hypothetical protein
MNNYSEYAVKISSDASYYGQVSPERASNIADDLARLIKNEFNGITVEISTEIGGKPVSGPDFEICEDINVWIQKNWTAAL